MDDFLKIVTRVVHLVSVSVISGVTILNYFFEATQYLAEDSNFRLIIMAMAMSTTISGIALMYQMKQGKELEGGQSVWSDMVKFKVIVSFFLNGQVVQPMAVMIVGSEDTEAIENVKTSVHFYAIVILLLTSVLSKLYREDLCNNFEKDPLHEKLDEIR